MSISTLLATSMTVIFLGVVVSYYVLLLIRVRKPDYHKKFKSITVIIPARNEAPYLGECIASVLAAGFDGRKQVIVVDDGSRDATSRIARSFGVTVLRNRTHLGKSASLNKALRRATGDLVAVVDGDSVIARDALTELAREVARENVAAAAAVVKARNRTRFINIWVHLELLYASLLRSIFSKVHANVTTPGALSMYRRQALVEVGGFSTQGFSEDLDIAIRLIRKGYRVGFSDTAISETNMPDDVKGFLRQRTRFARGMIDILKRHLQLNSTIVDLYTMPLFVFSYLQAVIMSVITIAQIGSGYVTYFASKGVYVSWGVLKFFFEWFSIVGTVRWAYGVLTTPGALTLAAAVGILSTLLTYPLFLVAIIKYDKRVDLLHIIPLTLMFPFWFIIMLIYFACTPELFRTTQYNRWKKNE